MVAYLAVVRSYTPGSTSRMALSGKVPKAVARIADRINDFRPLFHFPMLETLTMPEGGNANLGRVLEEVFQVAGEGVPEGGRIARQLLSVGTAEILRVAYSYDGQSYAAWLIGRDRKIVAPKSPLTQIVEQATQEAVSLWEQGEKREAARTLRAVLDITEKDADCEAAYDRMSKSLPKELEEHGRRADFLLRWLKKHGILLLVGLVIATVMLGPMMCFVCAGLFTHR